MVCCSLEDTVTGSEYDNLINKLTKIDIQVEPVWHCLYYCKHCSTYWEEAFIEDRYVGRPYLKRVTAQYVNSQWGPEYLIQNRDMR